MRACASLACACVFVCVYVLARARARACVCVRARACVRASASACACIRQCESDTLYRLERERERERESVLYVWYLNKVSERMRELLYSTVSVRKTWCEYIQSPPTISVKTLRILSDTLFSWHIHSPHPPLDILSHIGYIPPRLPHHCRGGGGGGCRGDWEDRIRLCDSRDMPWYLRGGPLLEMGGDRQTSRWCQSNQNPFKCEKCQNTHKQPCAGRAAERLSDCLPEL